ncbi:MAG: DUF4087 domain-containing protein [Betaproteobacteria bacterium]|nr:DUF4087 domain-containing protein [Betaproteobacteria bacterium]
MRAYPRPRGRAPGRRPPAAASSVKSLRSLLLALAALLPCALAGAAPATTPPGGPVQRCGWFDNPTPGNAWLTDAQGRWLVGIQGGHQARGDWPDFSDDQWVSTNGHHGYGCACLRVVDDPRTHEIGRILRARARPLAACEHDPALRKRHPVPDSAQR